MSVRTFIDTNILVYAFTADEKEKQTIALDYLSNCIPVISTQVIKEFSNVMLKKSSAGLQTIKETVKEIAEVCTEIVVEEPELIFDGYDLHEEYRYSFYDSLIIAAALKAKCEVLLSEDMADGHIIESLNIKNPFLA